MNLSEKNRNAKNCLKQIFKSEGCVKPFRLSREAISQVSEDLYLTEFVSWNLDYFSLFYFFPLPGGAHWALEPRKVTLKSQIWKRGLTACRSGDNSIVTHKANNGWN